MRLCKFKRLNTNLKQPYFVLRNLYDLKSGGIDKMSCDGQVFAMKHCHTKALQLKILRLSLQIDPSTKSYFQ